MLNIRIYMKYKNNKKIELLSEAFDNYSRSKL